MVGVIGFEPTTPSPPAKCATKLRHTPTEARILLISLMNAMGLFRAFFVVRLAQCRKT